MIGCTPYEEENVIMRSAEELEEYYDYLGEIQNEDV